MFIILFSIGGLGIGFLIGMAYSFGFHLKKLKHERIVCAANWYKDLPTATYNPKNIANGIVICGLRHNNPIDVLKTLAELRSVSYGIDAAGPHEQGFLTTHNRFVSREEAFIIAQNCGQLNNRARGGDKRLFSEDLY